MRMTTVKDQTLVLVTDGHHLLSEIFLIRVFLFFSMSLLMFRALWDECVITSVHLFIFHRLFLLSFFLFFFFHLYVKYNLMYNMTLKITWKFFVSLIKFLFYMLCKVIFKSKVTVPYIHLKGSVCLSFCFCLLVAAREIHRTHASADS